MRISKRNGEGNVNESTGRGKRSGTKKMPKVGFEPTRPYRHCALNTACLPVSPLRHYQICPCEPVSRPAGTAIYGLTQKRQRHFSRPTCHRRIPIQPDAIVPPPPECHAYLSPSCQSIKDLPVSTWVYKSIFLDISHFYPTNKRPSRLCIFSQNRPFSSLRQTRQPVKRLTFTANDVF